MRTRFDPTTIEHFRWGVSYISLMRLHAHTEIETNYGQTYTYDYDIKVWFDFGRNE